MIGLDYNDPKWDELLDQMTFDETNSLIGDAFHWTMPVKSVEAPATRDENGPRSDRQPAGQRQEPADRHRLHL